MRCPREGPTDIYTLSLYLSVWQWGECANRPVQGEPGFSQCVNKPLFCGFSRSKLWPFCSICLMANASICGVDGIPPGIGQCYIYGSVEGRAGQGKRVARITINRLKYQTKFAWVVCVWLDACGAVSGPNETANRKRSSRTEMLKYELLQKSVVVSFVFLDNLVFLFYKICI